MFTEKLYSNRWLEYYDNPAKRISLKRITSTEQIHYEFLQTVLKTEPDQAIEIGIGTGALGYSLNHIARSRRKKIKVFELDLYYEFLLGAQNFCGKTSDLKFCTADTFYLPLINRYLNAKRTTIFHQGLMEHFDDNLVTQMVGEQLRVANTVVASVPSNKYCFRDGLKGDERLLSLDQWLDILGNNFNVSGYYYGKSHGEKYQICLTINAK